MMTEWVVRRKDTGRMIGTKCGPGAIVCNITFWSKNPSLVLKWDSEESAQWALERYEGDFFPKLAGKLEVAEL
jgi:hypothetical protein